MTTGAGVAVQRYALHAQQYLGNALLALQSGEAGKAGELLWGSVAEALHAVAAINNRPVRTHRDLKNFAMQLARDLNDQTIEKDFVVAESLHHNFYDVQQEPQDIAIVVPTVQELVKRLLGLLPRKGLEKPENT
jgi:hypothetical protein